ncbi:MAG: 4-(cytidine 5'-diphospho)-2-C-methyl-D-erythritol kinase [Pseudomonadota bacterium]
MTAVEVFAPAKVNLTLHVTGQRADGYHCLDSLVVFADIGDKLTLSPAPAGGLQITGPYASAVPAGPDNLVARALGLLPGAGPLAITLEKRIPVAAGLGGGSADAAAALRGAAAVSGAPNRPDPLALLSLGADLPMCLRCNAARVGGIGEQVQALEPALPRLPAVLVNPNVGLETPRVFQALSSKINTPMSVTIPAFSGAVDCAKWLRQRRNDLEAPATQLLPAIGHVLDALAGAPGTLLARMSGSGATCFGLFADEASARKASTEIARSHPGWWVAPCLLGDQCQLADPRPANRQSIDVKDPASTTPSSLSP